MKRILFAILLCLLTASPASAFGTYGEGRAIVYLKSIASKGVFFTSIEGVFEIATYNKDEKCAKAEECYTPQKENLPFSVDMDNKETIQFLQKNVDRVMLISYRINRVTPITLSTGFEILHAWPLHETQQGDFPWKFVSRKTGSSNYSVFGKVLRLEYRGTSVGTYEGLYYDRKFDRIVPFSVTDDNMAKHIYRCMESMQEYNIGISRAIVVGWRETKLDIFEINYRDAAGEIQ